MIAAHLVEQVELALDDAGVAARDRAGQRIGEALLARGLDGAGQHRQQGAQGLCLVHAKRAPQLDRFGQAAQHEARRVVGGRVVAHPATGRNRQRMAAERAAQRLQHRAQAAAGLDRHGAALDPGQVGVAAAK